MWSRYICEVRGYGGRLGVVLIGDEYDQAPPFLYEEPDYVSVHETAFRVRGSAMRVSGEGLRGECWYG